MNHSARCTDNWEICIKCILHPNGDGDVEAFISNRKMSQVKSELGMHFSCINVGSMQAYDVVSS